jgi:hypothetical protein
MIQQHGKLYWSLKPHLSTRQPELHAGFTPDRLTTGWDLKSEIIGTQKWESSLAQFAIDFPETDISAAWADHEAAAEMLNRHRLAATGTQVYLRFGKLPRSGYSTNHTTGEPEPGISVYEGRKVGNRYYLILTDVDASSALFCVWGRQAYLVTGEVAGFGSDGEKCLFNCKARKLSDEIIPVI